MSELHNLGAEQEPFAQPFETEPPVSAPALGLRMRARAAALACGRSGDQTLPLRRMGVRQKRICDNESKRLICPETAAVYGRRETAELWGVSLSRTNSFR